MKIHFRLTVPFLHMQHRAYTVNGFQCLRMLWAKCLLETRQRLTTKLLSLSVLFQDYGYISQLPNISYHVCMIYSQCLLLPY